MGDDNFYFVVLLGAVLGVCVLVPIIGVLSPVEKLGMVETKLGKGGGDKEEARVGANKTVAKCQQKYEM